jgi:hypothetical protein
VNTKADNRDLNHSESREGYLNLIYFLFDLSLSQKRLLETILMYYTVADTIETSEALYNYLSIASKSSKTSVKRNFRIFIQRGLLTKGSNKRGKVSLSLNLFENINEVNQIKIKIKKYGKYEFEIQ